MIRRSELVERGKEITAVVVYCMIALSLMLVIIFFNGVK
jgi:hypothetical protein